ncbi:MAG: hypothetical protein CFE43_12025 [Burkholderiales bacterium PBB3]|nr:MAG: hypothetical protein CFE43_12025 [Burkholderiales bacterium PBB3]
MRQDHPPDLQAALEHASTALTAAIAELSAMPEGEERSGRLRDIATMLAGSTEALRAQAIQLCPDLESAEPIPDTQLHESEREAVSRLTVSDIKVIDRALVASATTAWRHGTRVIGETLVSLNDQFPGVSLGFYAQRVAALVQSGKLQARGNIKFMRLCEIKLSAENESLG